MRWVVAICPVVEIVRPIFSQTARSQTFFAMESLMSKLARLYPFSKLRDPIGGDFF